MGLAIRKACAAGLKLFEKTAELVQDCERAGRAVANGGALEAATRELRHLAEEHEHRWPFIDTPETHEQIRLSHEQYARGEYRDVEDLLHAMESRG
jgi:hypothetical protein